MSENETEMCQMRSCVVHKKRAHPYTMHLLQNIDLLSQAVCFQGVEGVESLYIICNGIENYHLQMVDETQCR